MILYSEKKEKDEVGIWGAYWKTAQNLWVVIKAISVFNKVEMMCACVESVNPVDERAENTERA